MTSGHSSFANHLPFYHEHLKQYQIWKKTGWKMYASLVCLQKQIAFTIESV